MPTHLLKVYYGNPFDNKVKAVFLGSAFVVDEITAVTAAHIFEQVPVEYLTNNPTSVYAVGRATGADAYLVQKVDVAENDPVFHDMDACQNKDIAALHIGGTNKFLCDVPPATYISDLKVGDECKVVGYGEPDENPLVNDAKGSILNQKLGISVLNGDVSKGMSGGYVNFENKICGMTVSRNYKNGQIDIVPFSRIQKFLEVVMDGGPQEVTQVKGEFTRSIAIISTNEESPTHQVLLNVLDKIKSDGRLNNPNPLVPNVALNTSFSGLPVDYATVRSLLSEVEVCFVVISKDDIKDNFKLASLFGVLSFFRERLGRPRVRIIQGDNYDIFSTMNPEEVLPQEGSKSHRSFPDLSNVRGVLIKDGYDPIRLLTDDEDANITNVVRFLGVLTNTEEDENGLVDFVKVIHPSLQDEVKRTYDEINSSATLQLVVTGIGFSNLVVGNNIDDLVRKIKDEDLTLWLLIPSPNLILKNESVFRAFRGAGLLNTHRELLVKLEESIQKRLDEKDRAEKVCISFHDSFLPFIAYASDLGSPLGKMIVRHIYPTVGEIALDQTPEHQIYIVKRARDGLFDRYTSVLDEARANSSHQIWGNNLIKAIELIDKGLESK